MKKTKKAETIEMDIDTVVDLDINWMQNQTKNICLEVMARCDEIMFETEDRPDCPFEIVAQAFKEAYEAHHAETRTPEDPKILKLGDKGKH